jgi:cytochrome c-type biogenesis protein CcmH/NrfF
MQDFTHLPWWSVPLALLFLVCFILLSAAVYRRMKMTPEERWRERYDRRLKRSIKKRGT